MRGRAFTYFAAIYMIPFVMNGIAVAGNELITDCKVVAHRGYSYVAPENTVAAINRAVAVGAQGSEFDVYKCASGEVVLMHDSTVDRTTDGAYTGSVTSLTLTQLKTLDAGSWKSATYAGERVPTMTEALAALKNTGTAAVCEIKQSGIADEVYDCMSTAGMLDQSVVISFTGNELKTFKTYAPDVPTGLLLSSFTGSTTAAKVAWAQTQMSTYKTDFLDVTYGALTKELVAALEDVDIPVWTWTVNSTASMENMYDWGVESVTTDRPDLALAVAPVPEPGAIALVITATFSLAAYAWRRRKLRNINTEMQHA